MTRRGAADRDELAGRNLGGFIVRERIGEGGFGAVYRAEQPLLGREAVVKLLHTRHRQRDDMVQRFLREARLASRLDHPYAAHVYASGWESDGLLWIAMELVRGQLLAQMLAGGKTLPLPELCELLDHLCEVVQTAHEQGIVHRDIKPTNVMVITRAGRTLPKLLDLGIAKSLGGTLRGDEVEVDVEVAPVEPALEDVSRTLAAPEGAAGRELTAAGAILGSPLYMAPEQWSLPASVDARADVYALGVLAYEALAGIVPFLGSTLAVLREAHASWPVPPLVGTLPRALDAVLARAMAKRPEDRFASALELAASFRAAAGLGAPAAPPVLDEALAAGVVARAPQPIAEATALLGGARNAHQARDVIFDIVSAVARVLSVLALAARSRAGGADGPEVSRLLARFGAGPVHDEDRVALARELTRPFAARAATHPLPALVRFFHEGSADGGALLERLEAARETAASDEGEVSAFLRRVLPDLARLLRGVAFLEETPLVVPRFDGGADVWMGVRRPVRPYRAVGGDPPPGRPLLLDGDGQPLLALWPLCQVAYATPETPAELFLFDGPGQRGARLVAPPAGFAIEDPAVWTWLGRELTAPGAPGSSEEPPYRGLAAFTRDDAGSFFGRERETQTVANRLRVQPLVAIVGPSGAGKSSFVQAGVLPALPETWQTIAVRPGPAPLAALAAALARAGRKEGGSIAECLRAGGGAMTVLFVDQLEEIFTQCLDARERNAFAATLAEAARSVDDPVRVIVTLRDDFLIRADALEPLRARLGLALQLLSTPEHADLVRILGEPLARSGYHFDDPALPERMVDEVAGKPGALALLSFTARALWELRDRHFRVLRRQSYEAIGGVGGALAQHAESTLQAFTAAEQRLARDTFRHLISAEGTRAALRRAELRELLGDGADETLEKLVAARLVIVSEADEGERVELIHETLLTAWPRLVRWQREDAEGARLRDQLRAAARQWDERGRPRGLLWRDEALAELSAWRARHGARGTRAEEDFADASVADSRRGRRWRVGLVAAAFAVLLVGVGLLYRARDAERAAAAEAGQRVAELYDEQGRQALLGQDPMHALLYLGEAYARGLRGPSMDFALTRAAQFAGHQLLTLPRGTPVRCVDLSPDGRLLATGNRADGVARVWDARDGRLVGEVRHAGPVTSVAFSGDGARLASVGGDAIVWRVADGVVALRVEGADFARLSPDGGRLAVADGERPVVRLFDVATGRAERELTGHAEPVTALGFSGDGARLVTGSYDLTARVWSTADGAALAVTPAHETALSAVAVSPDGRRFATAADRVARVFTIDGAPVATFRGHAAFLSALELSRDGVLLTASYDATLKLWNAGSGDLRASLVGHKGPVWSARFSHDGSRVASVSDDGTARLWSVAGGGQVGLLVGHANRVFGAAFSGDDTVLATGSDDGTARLWRTHRDDLLTELPHHERLWGARFVGERVLTVGYERVLRTWDGDRLASELATGPKESSQYFFLTTSHDGRLAALPRGDDCEIYDLDAGRRVASLRAPAPLRSAAFGPGATIVTAHADGTAIVWQGDEKQRVVAGHQGDVLVAELDPTGTLLMTGGRDRTARLTDIATGRTLLVLRHDASVSSAAFVPGGELLVTGADKLGRVWRIADGAPVATLAGHTGPIQTLAVSASGLIATGASDGTTRVWSLAGKELYRFSAGTSDALSVVFSDDQQRLLSATGSTARLWDVTTRSWDVPELGRLVSCHVPFRLNAPGRLPVGPCP